MKKLLIFLITAMLLLTGCSLIGQETDDAPAVDSASAPISVTDLPAPEIDLNIDTDIAEPETKPIANDNALLEGCEYGIITDKETIIETEHVTIKVAKGVFIPPYVIESMDELYEALEEASGLSFTEAKFGARPVVEVVPADPSRYPNASKLSETGTAYASGETATCSPLDLIFENCYTLAHELSHVLALAQYGCYPGKTLSEGFAEYNCYKAYKLLEERHSRSVVLGSSQGSVNNMCIYGGSIYEQPVDRWMTDGFPYSGNSDYAVGFRLMSYLDAQYGDFTRWTKEINTGSEYFELEPDKQDDVINASYGGGAISGFYPWLKKNEDRFIEDYGFTSDLTAYDSIDLYPIFNALGGELTIITTVGASVEYDDLVINLDCARYYLEEYKGIAADKLALTTDAAQLELLDADGDVIESITGGCSAKHLDGVSAVRLCGKGKVSKFNITGFVHQ